MDRQQHTTPQCIGPTTDDLKSRDEFAGGTYSYQGELDGRIVPAAAACPTICTICCQLYHFDYCVAASARNFTAFMLLTTNDSSVYVPTASSTLLFFSSVVGSLQGSLVRRKARPNQIGGMQQQGLFCHLFHSDNCMSLQQTHPYISNHLSLGHCGVVQ